MQTMIPQGSHRCPYCWFCLHALTLIDGFVAAADLQVTVIVLVIRDHQLIVSQLQLCQAGNALHITGYTDVIVIITKTVTLRVVFDAAALSSVAAKADGGPTKPCCSWPNSDRGGAKHETAEDVTAQSISGHGTKPAKLQVYALQ